MGWFKRTFGEETRAGRVTPKQKRATRRNFATLYPSSAKVILKQPINPKRAGSKARDMYDLYSHELCSTVEDCTRAGMSYRDIDGDVRRGYVEVIKDEVS